MNVDSVVEGQCKHGTANVVKHMLITGNSKCLSMIN